jgi:aspartyl-tRNA(Asn)/glutamyl-tRNA(Gln) amidotransferase subunit C
MVSKPTIDDAVVRHVAKLARLELSEAEVARFTPQLQSILSYVAQLQKLDTDAVEPFTRLSDTSDATRADVVRQGLDSAAALANAPERHESFFRVPPVLDSGASA